MFAKIYLFCIISSFISGTFACNGCKIADFSVTGCSDTNEEILQLSCATVELDEQCSVVTNCSRKIMEPIQQAQLILTGSMLGVEYREEFPDICDALKQQDFHGDASQIMNVYALNETCGGYKDYSEFEIRRRPLDDDIKRQIEKGAGHFESKIQLKSVNGKEGSDVCYKIDTYLKCDKQRRKPKTQ